MTTTDFKIYTVCTGVARLLDENGDAIATLERSKGGMTPNHGQWFACATPSHVDAMAYQADRWPHAVAWGHTRKECAKAFLDAR